VLGASIVSPCEKARQRRRLLEDEQDPIGENAFAIVQGIVGVWWYVVRCVRDEVSRDTLLVINIVIHKNKDAC
jgi:hypothetical protein